MKNCYSCENMLTDDAAYCYVCNTSQDSGFEAFEKRFTTTLSLKSFASLRS